MKGLLRSVRRNLNLHEFQAASILSKRGLPVLRGGSAQTPEEAQKVATSLHGGVVVKAQIHAGGRGRGHFAKSGLQSGVHVLENDKEVTKLAGQMLGDVLVTKQSGKEGKPVKYLYIVERVDIKKEIYLAVMLDRERANAMIIASPRGGMGIEEIDKRFILQQPIPNAKITAEHIEKVASFLEPENEKQKADFASIIENLFKAFTELDATLIEINPLGVLNDGRVLICDSKVNLDDNAAFRQKEVFALEDKSQKDPNEVKAESYDLSYVKLKGNVGCLVNGAGLAMATMDLINFQGGKPANFLDIGGGATIDRVSEAIQIIDADSDAKSILVNIFGGIVRCDVVADGLIKAAQTTQTKKPIVARIKGTNSELAKQMIEASKLSIFWCEDINQAVNLAIQKSKS